MGPWDYIVVRINGDYADLRRTDIDSDEIFPVAMALLPPETDEGTRLHCEFFQYEIIE